MSGKKNPVTKGPQGEKAKFPGTKHVQIQRGLALRLINAEVTETEIVNGEEVHFAYQLHDKIGSLKYDPSMMIPQMLSSGYLVKRSNDPESYYIFTSKQKGLAFRRQQEAA